MNDTKIHITIYALVSLLPITIGILEIIAALYTA